MEKNKLVYKKSKKVEIDGELFQLIITLSLDDKCKNGHCDFSATYDMYKGIRLEACGCSKTLLLEYFPEFKQIIDLHLSNFEGKPFLYLANGFYHMRDKEVAMEYLRITEDEFNSLLKARNVQVFEFLLTELGIIDRWKKEADEAIKMLESLTKDKWVNPYQDNIN